MTTSRIHDLVREGRITPAQGAFLLEMRRQVEWNRRPWYVRLLAFVGRML